MIGEPELVELLSEAWAGRVARDLAHEINNLLVGVVGVATDAMTHGASLERWRALEAVARYGQEVAELVRSFQLSFPAAGYGAAARLVKVAEVLDRSVLLCRDRARGQGVNIRKRYTGVPMVEADVGKLEQVFVGLFHRALDEMPGGGALEVATARRGERTAVTLSAVGAGVADVGVPPATADGAKRTDARLGVVGRSSREVGLRAFELPLIRSVIDRHGGTLLIESVSDRRPCFTVLLPGRETAATDSRPEPPEVPR